MNRKPRDPLYPDVSEKTSQLKKEMLDDSHSEDEDLTLLKKLNHKIGVYLSPKTTDITEDEKKKKIGVIITTAILITLIISGYYFLIYEPSQEDLSLARTTKLNELHDLYKGPLASSPNEIALENQITNAKNPEELEIINIIAPATKDWKDFHKKSININQDKFNRTMATYGNGSKSVILNIDEASQIVNENDVYTLSDMKFEKPNTISVPVSISRLQAGAGLLTVGSKVDIYTNNDTNETSESDSTPDISGCTVLSIMRYEDSGEIDAQYSKSNMFVNGNNTNPQENTRAFTSNVLEMLKGSIINGYDEKETLNLLDSYGIKLSSYERQINLGDLDAEYMLLIEVPQDKVNYVISNMDDIILTIPTDNAPNWMADKITIT